MNHRRVLKGCLVCALVLSSISLAQSLKIKAGENLTLLFNDMGQLTNVAANDKPIAATNKPGGFFLRKYSPEILGDILLTENFDDLAPAGNNVQLLEDENGERLARLNATGYRDGLVLDAISISQQDVLSINWRAKTLTPLKFIIYTKLFSANGKDITADAATDENWSYSENTDTRFRIIEAKQSGNHWQNCTTQYCVPAKVKTVAVRIAIWKGHSVDIDNVEIKLLRRQAAEKKLTGSLKWDNNSASYKQTIKPADDNLRFDITYKPMPNHLLVKGSVADISSQPAEHCIDLTFVLPINANNWLWHDDIRNSRKISKDQVFENNIGSIGVSSYPWSVISSNQTAVSMAVPMDVPRMEIRRYSSQKGLEITFSLALSPMTKKIGPSKTDFAFLIYPADPEWGFRSAAQTYYNIFPQFFTKRTDRQGLWLYPIHPVTVDHPEDFGITFWEGYSNDKAELDQTRKQGIFILPYICPRERTQAVDVQGDKPDHQKSYQQALDTVKTWSNENSKKIWRDAPRHITAKAMLNSLPTNADGVHPFRIWKYSRWSIFWQLNCDPDLPKPNMASICEKYRFGPRIDSADGVYIDNVFLFGTPNYRPEHIAVADQPLTFDKKSATPYLSAAFSYYDFLEWLSEKLHNRGKIIQMNIVPTAYRFYAQFGDVLGEEVGSKGRRPRTLYEVESDEICCIRRTFALHKPVTNLLQEGSYEKPVPELDQQGVKQYIEHQLFYGFYPGISTIGGEEKPGYAGWKRYFGPAKQYERDRQLFKKYIPILRRINNAGWQPVTYAKTNQKNIWVERFGSWENNDLHFTVRNHTDKPANCRLSIKIPQWQNSTKVPAVTVTELTTDKKVPADFDFDKRELIMKTDMTPYKTMVYSIDAQ